MGFNSGFKGLNASDCHQTNKSVTSHKNRAQTQLWVPCDHGNWVTNQTRLWHF